MSKRTFIILAGVLFALVALVFTFALPVRDTSSVDAEIARLVKQYDDQVYGDGSFKDAQAIVERILELADRSSVPSETKVRGLIRSVYANIKIEKRDVNWRMKFADYEALISKKPTLARAECLLYFGHLIARWEQRDFEAGLKSVQEGLRIAEQLSDDRMIALAYVFSYELQVLIDRDELAVVNAFRAVTVADHYGEKSVKGLALRKLAREMMYQEEISEAAEAGLALLRLFPRSMVAKYPMFVTGKSSRMIAYVDMEIKRLEKRTVNGRVTKEAQGKMARLLNQLARGYFIRKEFSKCRETCERAIPLFEASDDSENLASCLAHLELANLDFANDTHSVDEVFEGATSDAEAALYADAIAAAYAEQGDRENNLYWQERALNARIKSRSELIGFMKRSSELYWESKLETRKEIELNNKANKEFYSRVYLWGAALAVGLSVYTLLIGFSYIYQKSRSLEGAIEARTESLMKAMQKSRAADLAKSEFLAQINHEIRNPLTAILGYCELLSLNNKNPNEIVSGIESSSIHLRELVDKILEVSKIETNGLKAQLVEFFPAQTVKDIRGIMAKQAVNRDLNLECNFIGDSNHLILSDEIKIRQIALNLIGNAIKFTETGSVNASFKLNELDKSSRAELVINVHDTGIGIAADQTTAVFERFTKASNAASRDGSGLGLYITQQLVECMGGEITLNSSIGVGTQVSAALPVEVVGVAFDSPKRIASEKNGAVGNPQISGKRVLIVDDQETIRNTLQLQLQSRGVECKADWKLERTIQLVENWRPDLVLLDLRMPNHSGFEVLEKIRKSKVSCVLVYAMTGDATVRAQQKCLSLGFDGFITKPFNMNSVLEILEEPHKSSLPNAGA